MAKRKLSPQTTYERTRAEADRYYNTHPRVSLPRNLARRLREAALKWLGNIYGKAE